MKAIIDRFEEDYAVIETDGKMFNFPRALIPDAHEGDTIEITVSAKNSDERKEAASALFERLRQKKRECKNGAPKAKEFIVDDERGAYDNTSETPENSVSDNTEKG